MDDIAHFGFVVASTSLVLVVAVLSSRLGVRLRVPAPALFLVGAAVASDIVPVLGETSIQTVQNVVSVALAVILFNGGMDVGWQRFRANATAIVWIGVAGTLVTAAAMAALTHWLFGFDWRLALLLATALAPTDPAVVFSVLGRRELSGRAGVLLEGESGANDPVGIAMMIALLTVGTTGGLDAVGTGLRVFALQLGLGAVLGLAGGLGLLWFMRHVSLPLEALYPVRVLAAAGLLFGATTLAGGSGFLAVFVAGIVVGDARAPFKAEVERFHSALASLGEVVAFTVLGLTVRVDSLADRGAWLIGLGVSVLLALLVRPLLVGLVLLPVRLRGNERLFMLWAGLKGAVPVLLGTYVLTSGEPDAVRVYDVIFVVVAFSVIVQGGLVPFVARRLEIPMRAVSPQPWELGMRFRDEPSGLRHYTVMAGSAADSCTVADLPLGEGAWISFVRRDGGLLQVRGSTRLQVADEVLLLADEDQTSALDDVFGPASG